MTSLYPRAALAIIGLFVVGAPALAADPDSGGGPTVKGIIGQDETRMFWAFQRPVVRPAPKAKSIGWIKNEIDAFVLVEREKRGLRPMRPVGKRELIRRATFDLIGLPPTPKEIEGFEQDPSPDAFARVVDRLLASPHYGERWGRYWLDLARYADDKALAFVTPWPHAYRYRDWVVRAFNADMPYDQFLRLQLAADLVPEQTDGDRERRLVALGYQGLGAEYHKGSVPAQVIADELDDRIDTLTRGVLGLTVACARCHDHKYDPISTRDYYSLGAAYQGASWDVLTVSPPAEVVRHQAWEKQGKEIEVRIGKWSDQQRAVVLQTALHSAGKYLLSAWRLRLLRKQGVAAPEAALAQREKLQAHFLTRSVAWLEAVNRKMLPSLLAEWLQAAEQAQAQAKLEGGEPAVPEILLRITDKLQGAISTALEEKERRTKSGSEQGKKKSAKPTPPNEELLQALTQGKAPPFAFEPKHLPSLVAPDARKQFDALQEELKRHRQSAPPALRQAHGVRGGGEAMRIAKRGNANRLGETAPPGFLPILQTKPAESRARFTRLDLAEAVCSPDNPLTARVIVNRVWQHHFGRGIVGTSSNFGKLGDRPTHPQLLDNLAVRFMQSGWSIKWLHRQMMLSSLYRQSSAYDSQNAAIDPDNAYLWRHTPRRLDIEAWRDAILAVSGRLDRTRGGPPRDLAEPGHVRRTLYGKVSRRDPDKMLVAFDFPDANVSSARRVVTVVPQQQLFVLNSNFMIASARALADRLKHAADTDEERIALIHLWAFGRAATEAETRLGLEFLQTVPAGPDDKLTAWEQYAQAILAANEFVWID